MEITDLRRTLGRPVLLVAWIVWLSVVSAWVQAWRKSQSSWATKCKAPIAAAQEALPEAELIAKRAVKLCDAGSAEEPSTVKHRWVEVWSRLEPAAIKIHGDSAMSLIWMRDQMAQGFRLLERHEVFPARECFSHVSRSRGNVEAELRKTENERAGKDDSFVIRMGLLGWIVAGIALLVCSRGVWKRPTELREGAVRRL